MKKKLFVFFLIIGAISALYPFMVLAQDGTDQPDVGDLEDKIAKYEKKLSELQGQEKTLSREIEYMDGQINLTQLRIQNSIAKIASMARQIEKLAVDIDDIKNRIVKLEGSIDYQKKVLSTRLRTRYKTQESSPVLVFFGSDTLNQLIQRSEYLQVMELQDNKMLGEMDKTKNAYVKQKDLFEDKKIESEQLKANSEAEKANLDNYKVTLENQKNEKKRLLDVTQNNEAKYQNLLEEAQKELRQITGAVGVLMGQSGERINKGDAIGTQGNSGYSTGDHLHFGVYKYSSFAQINGWNWYYSNYIDPAKMLKSKTVNWDTGCEGETNKTVGKGSWSWPMASPTVSQGFGHTCWSDIYYEGKDHPAYDMYGSYGSSVYAADDGTAYYCRNCLGDGGNGVFIFHDDGYMTLYWHLR